MKIMEDEDLNWIFRDEDVGLVLSRRKIFEFFCVLGELFCGMVVLDVK